MSDRTSSEDVRVFVKEVQEFFKDLPPPEEPVWSPEQTLVVHQLKTPRLLSLL